MATLDKLIQEIDSRYRLGPKACLLVQETLNLITGQPGGIGDFLNTFKAAGFAAEVASWLGGTSTVPLSGQEVEQTLGCDVVSEIANKVGVSQRFARTILGYAIPRTIGLLATGGAIPSAIPVTASSFLDSAIPLSYSHVEVITQHGAEQIPPSRTEHGGSASRLGWLLIPGAALLITLGLLGYFISSRGAGDRVAIQSAPIVTQNAAVAIPHSPSIPARLALSNQNGLIVYSGTVGDDATRTAITDSLKTVFGAHKITGDLAVDLHAGAAGWTKDLKATLDNFKTSGSQALFEGNEVSVGGTIAEADRDGIISSLKSAFGSRFVFGTITDRGATNTAAVSTPRSGFNDKHPAGVLSQSALKFPTINFRANSAEVVSSSKPLLRQAARLIKQLPAGTVVEIRGYTHSVNNPTTNMQLSQRRANVVRRALAHAGVDPAMLRAKGYGSPDSLASKNGTVESRSNGMMEDRRRNDRRVEFSIAQQ
jgi:OOP family OmpA-OmpF porin